MLGGTAPPEVFEHFGDNICGIVDTFPIIVRRPKDKTWARFLYNGKYKHHVVKVQAICNFDGVPLFVSGPHAGTRHDVRIWREYGPALLADEQVLGDKAYVGEDDCIAPVKRLRGQAELDPLDADFNIVHSWYRGGIEHCNAQLKKFAILNGKNRARLRADSANRRLESAVRVITAIIQLQILHSPIRTFVDMLVPAEVDIIEAQADVIRNFREVINGCVIGKVSDLREMPDGSMRGPIADEFDTDPSNLGIDTGMIASDFRNGEEVLVWWWNLWWRAKIKYVAARKNRVTVTFDWSKKSISNYFARLVQKM